MTDIMDRAASLSTLDITFLIIKILGCFWYLFISFSTGSEMLEVFYIHCQLTSILKFGTTSIKKLSKIFAIVYLFLSS